MPKNEIDYSNTIIYKITCKDTEIKDVYVGHTTNFVQRKHAHKQSCINPNSQNYDCKLYNTIREKGGWSNWRMEIINFFNCYDHYEARQKEQEYFISLNANLNSIEPMPKPKEKPSSIIESVSIEEPQMCNLCKVNCHTLKQLEHHNKPNTYNSGCEGGQDFSCEKCNYMCKQKWLWDRHITTTKHQNAYKFTDNDLQKSVEKCYKCKCGNEYSHRQSLYTHRKKCKGSVENETIPQEEKQTETDIIVEMIKQNQEFKELLIEQNKIIIDAIKCNSIINNNNLLLKKTEQKA